MSEKRVVNCKKTIMFFSVLALILKVVECSIFVVVQGVNSDFILKIVGLIPYVLSLVYFFKFYVEHKLHIMLTMVFLSMIPDMMLSLKLYLSRIFDVGILSSSIILIVVFVYSAIPYVFAAIGTRKGSRKMINIPVVIVIIYLLAGLFSRIADLFTQNLNNTENLISNMSIMAFILLNLALLLFSTKNVISRVTFIPVEKMKAEKALKTIKDMLETGEITEEEYQAKREKIIKKL